MSIGIFAGTFDPPTNGHLNVIKKASKICDTLILAISKNSKKTPLFSDEERIDMLKRISPGIEIDICDELLVEFAKKRGADFLIRGLRSISDFEYETQMAMANRKLGGIETIFLTSDDEHTQVSSSLIREIIQFQGSIESFVPSEIESLIRKKFT